jgi:hypothetical protein
MREPGYRTAGKHHRDRQIEEALHHAHQGKLDMKCSPVEYLVRVNWTQ